MSAIPEWVAYAGGRVAAVLTRPACLFIANNYLAARDAENLAVLFLTSGLAVIFIAADPHRRYYARYFASGSSLNGLSFYLYGSSLALMILTGCVIAYAINLHFTQSVLTAVAGLAYFASERFADEFQRFRVFERRLHQWGVVAIWRCLTQLATFGVMVAVFREQTPAWLVAVGLAACNFLLFSPQLPARAVRNAVRLRASSVGWLVKRAARLLFASWPIWLTAQLTAGFGYIDRAVALVLDKSALPLFMLVVMCFSIVQLTVDFHYFTRYRRDFLERRISLGAAFRNRDFLLSLFGGLILSAIACWLVLRFARNGADFPLLYVAAIACLQASVAISTIPREILYWADRLRQILGIEVAFWGLFAAIVLASAVLDLHLTQIFALVAACSALRLIHYSIAAARVRVRPGQGTSLTSSLSEWGEGR